MSRDPLTPCLTDIVFVYDKTRRTHSNQRGRDIVKTVTKGLHNPKVKKVVLHKLNNI